MCDVCIIGKPCTFTIHTMKHQATMDSCEPYKVKFDIRTPKDITVDMIMSKVLERLGLTCDAAKKCFSIWLTSPQLRTCVYYILCT